MKIIHGRWYLSPLDLLTGSLTSYHVPLEHHQLEPLFHLQPIDHQHHHVSHYFEH